MRGGIDSNKILEVSDDKGQTQLLKSFKSTVILLWYGFYFINKPHLMIFVNFETNFRDY